MSFLILNLSISRLLKACPLPIQNLAHPTAGRAGLCASVSSKCTRLSLGLGLSLSLKFIRRC